MPNEQKFVVVVLRLPISEEATPDDLDMLLRLLERDGFTKDLGAHLAGGKLYVHEAGISADGVTAAVLDSKFREANGT